MAESPWGRALFCAKTGDAAPVIIAVTGRERWALECLMAAGRKGCSPFDQPGPRWSGYVHDLRRMGLQINTDYEAHTGPFPGHHARYRLVSDVKRLAECST